MSKMVNNLPALNVYNHTHTDLAYCALKKHEIILLCCLATTGHKCHNEVNGPAVSLTISHNFR